MGLLRVVAHVPNQHGRVAEHANHCLFAHRLFLEPCDKKTTYDTHNTTTVVNITSYENITQVENVTITETIVQLENITTQENVSVLINETVRYNATYVCPGPKLTSSRRPRVIARSCARRYNVSYDVMRNVTYDVTYNQTYNVTFNTTVNVRTVHKSNCRGASPPRLTD